ncbi:MAG: ribosome-associated translation inhibitor RaiA [Candidatus Zixiibacteriota bacterium]
MQIRTTARHFDLTDDLKRFVENQTEKLEKYFNNIIDTHLILDAEKSRMTAELKVKVYGTVLTSKYGSFDMYDSVEKVIDKMGGQLQRYKERLKDKNAKKAQKVSPLKKGTEASPDAEDMESGEAGL